MGIVIDTCLLIEKERKRFDLEKLVRGREDEAFGISAITASELLYGVHMANTDTRRIRRNAFVERVLGTFPIYPFGLAEARIYADLWTTQRKSGHASGSHDLIIAATALSRGDSVLTFNRKHFVTIQGLTVETPEIC
jgi:tRNA(fMet)-specific endonuclease VapC